MLGRERGPIAVDRLIALARQFQSGRINADEFRELFVEVVTRATGDDLLSLAYFFADAELDDEMFDEPELIKQSQGGYQK